MNTAKLQGVSKERRSHFHASFEIKSTQSRRETCSRPVAQENENAPMELEEKLEERRCGMKVKCSILVFMMAMIFCAVNLSNAIGADSGYYGSLGIGYSIPEKQKDRFNEEYEFKNGVFLKGAVGIVSRQPVTFR